jgi:hypothetical protein
MLVAVNRFFLLEDNNDHFVVKIVYNNRLVGCQQ